MLSNIVNRFKGEEIKENEMQQLKRNLEITKIEISEINDSLNFITDPILMNQQIYQLKAAQMRYRYWFKMAKELRIKEIKNDAE